MSKREIIVNISTGGDVKLEGVGFNGRECDLYMEPIEKALAGSGEITKEYDERRQSQTQGQTVSQRW